MGDMPEQPPGGFPDTPEGRWEKEKWKKAFEEWERWNPIKPITGTPRPEPDPEPDPKEIKWLPSPGEVAKFAPVVIILGILGWIGAGVGTVSTGGLAPAAVIIGVGLMGASSAEAATPEPSTDSPSPSPGEPTVVVIPTEAPLAPDNPPQNNNPPHTEPPHSEPPHDEPPDHEPPEPDED